MPEIIFRDQARSLGLKRFFTGIPCVRGHFAERYVSAPGLCVACIPFRQKPDPIRRRAVRKAWLARPGNLEKTRQSKARYAVRNKEKRRQYAALMWAENRHNIRERCSLRRVMNRDKINQQARVWREKHRDRVIQRSRAFRERNRDRLNQEASLRKAENLEHHLASARRRKEKLSVLVGVARGLGLDNRERKVRETKCSPAYLERKRMEREMRKREGRDDKDRARHRKLEYRERQKLYRAANREKINATQLRYTRKRRVLAEIAKALLDGQGVHHV